jgi:hypothetical protein
MKTLIKKLTKAAEKKDAVEVARCYGELQAAAFEKPGKGVKAKKPAAGTKEACDECLDALEDFEKECQSAAAPKNGGKKAVGAEAAGIPPELINIILQAAPVLLRWLISKIGG